ncbi:hypothetical protein trd_1447 [Thermomicrobium roseum DSM 5159]|uniref:Uncharacterized protein n=1 Tax=Thermomicrobium roseum (strain ATCC 27502 / DSM 5159 / P-2) TaxID=309801 RepID=B9L2P3_THERP|nr:hypothetical protein trd_1447 [Thermomicrobium roseum DSM 5159]
MSEIDQHGPFSPSRQSSAPLASIVPDYVPKSWALSCIWPARVHLRACTRAFVVTRQRPPRSIVVEHPGDDSPANPYAKLERSERE